MLGGVRGIEMDMGCSGPLPRPGVEHCKSTEYHWSTLA